MLNWFIHHMATFIICAILIVVVAGIIFRLIFNRKKGKFSCGCSCGNCPMSDNCHNK